MALATAIALGAAGCRSSDGNLEARTPDVVIQLQPLAPGQREFTLNAGVLDEPGKDLEVLSLRTLTTPNVAYIGAVTVWPRNPGSITESGIGFPPPGRDDVHPAFGAVIPKSETGYLLPNEQTPRPVWVQAGFRLASGSLGAVNDVEVVYRVDGEEKRRRSGKSMIVCTQPCDERVEGRKDVVGWEKRIRDALGVSVSDSPVRATEAPRRRLAKTAAQRGSRLSAPARAARRRPSRMQRSGGIPAG